jgi:hypothetical protein
MKRLALSSALVLMVGLTMATAAQAQFEDTDGVPPETFRKGLWMSIGGGYGSQGCSACPGRIDGINGSITIGGSLSEQFLVGAAAGGWTTTNEAGTRLTVLMADCRFRIYPTRFAKWYITVGAGVSTISDEIFGPLESGEFAPGEWGTSFLIGTGFDIRVTSGMSLTPYVGIMGAKTENLDANVAHAGLAITIH